MHVIENIIESCFKEQKSPIFTSSHRFNSHAGLKHTKIERQISKKRLFLFSENAKKVATSGCTGKRDEDSVGDKKVLEENQLENIEDNQQEEVNIKGGFDFGYEKYIQVSKKTSSRIV